MYNNGRSIINLDRDKLSGKVNMAIASLEKLPTPELIILADDQSKIPDSFAYGIIMNVLYYRLSYAKYKRLEDQHG